MEDRFSSNAVPCSFIGTYISSPNLKMTRENGLGITNRSQLLKTHFLSAEVMVGIMGAPEICAIRSSPGLTIPSGPLGPSTI